MISKPGIFNLLDKLKMILQKNNVTHGDSFSICPRPNLKTGWRIPAIEKGVYLEPSPMLKCRFEYAGTWVNAEPGKSWLDLVELESVWDNTRVLRQLEIREKHFENSILSMVPKTHLSILGLDMDGREESYLHWKSDAIEPRIIQYYGGNENIFDNFYQFLVWLTTEK